MCLLGRVGVAAVVAESAFAFQRGRSHGLLLGAGAGVVVERVATGTLHANLLAVLRAVGDVDDTVPATLLDAGAALACGLVNNVACVRGRVGVGGAMLEDWAAAGTPCSCASLPLAGRPALCLGAHHRCKSRTCRRRPGTTSSARRGSAHRCRKWGRWRSCRPPTAACRWPHQTWHRFGTPRACRRRRWCCKAGWGGGRRGEEMSGYVHRRRRRRRRRRRCGLRSPVDIMPPPVC